MRVTVTAPERDLISRVLQFANLRGIGSTLQIEQLFSRAVLVRSGGVFQVIPSTEVDAYRDDQAVVQRALEIIASRDPQGRRRVGDLTRYTLAELIDVRLVLDPSGRLRIGFRLNGVLACCWFAIALLLDEARGLTNRVGRCGAPGCGRFNLSFAGRPRRHCSDDHRRRYDATLIAQRVRRWRKKRSDA